MTLSRLMLAASREIQAVSASRSNVRHTAERTPRGQVIGGRIVMSSRIVEPRGPRVKSRAVYARRHLSSEEDRRMRDVKQQLAKWIDDDRDTIIRFLTDFVRAKSP